MMNKYWVSAEKLRKLNEHNIWYKMVGYDTAAAPECHAIVIGREYLEKALAVLKGEI